MTHHPIITDILTGFHGPRTASAQVKRSDAAAIECLGTVDDRPGRSETLADTIEWLFVVFESRLGLTAVLACVLDCCRELDIDTNQSSISRVEQRAFRRLCDLADHTQRPQAAPRTTVADKPVSRTGPRGRA